jgi:O-antigen ligase
MLLVSTFVLPSIPLPGFLDIRFEDLILIAFFPILISRRRHFTPIDLGFILLGISTVISMLWGQFEGVAFNIRDLFELVKLIKYGLFFNVALYPWSEDDRKVIFKWFLIAITYSASVGIIQWRNLFGLGNIAKQFYAMNSPHLGEARVFGTMQNPNEYAMLLVTGIALILGAWYWFPGKRYLVAILAIVFVSMVTTTSRSGIASLVILCLIITSLRFFWLRGISRRVWQRTALIILFITLFVLLPVALWGASQIMSFQSMSPEQILTYTLKSPLNALIYSLSVSGGDNGIGLRLANWKNNWSIFLQSPWLGLGPGKSIYTSVVDSEYILYLRRYGILGLGALLSLYWIVARRCWKILKLAPYSSAAWGLSVAVLAILSAFVVVNFVISTFYILQLMSLFWLLVGLNYSYIYFRKNQSNLRSI